MSVETLYAAPPVVKPEVDALEAHIREAADALRGEQRADGHWVYELEGDVTVPAEYILFRHFRGEPDDLELERKIAAYIRRTQGAHGGWPLVHDGPFNISASVKAYFALKMVGDSPDADHMQRARAAILAYGGASRANVFTRILLALYGIIPWRAVPVMPVEIMLLPRWFPFHLTKISYWARVVIVPLLVIQAFKPRARNLRGVTLDELFIENPRRVGPPKKAPHQRLSWFLFFRAVDAILRSAEPLMPKGPRQRAIEKAKEFVIERLNGEDGLGAVFPSMANAVLMFDLLGYPPDHPHLRTARAALEKLLIIRDDEAYAQPCVSPVWDTALASHALLEAGGEANTAAATRALTWLAPLQLLDLKGDWAVARPKVRPGGWAFQYANPHYPDLDDTAVIMMGMDRAAPHVAPRRFDEAIARGREWVLGMQSDDGAWAAFDADNSYHYLNNIPFADHGALLDPPTEDVTARCVSMLAQLGDTPATSPAIARAVEYLRKSQLPDGSWYGRWGVNYIYGTWSVLSALNAIGLDHDAPEMRRAVAWLLSIQNEDGGWGEDVISYRLDYRGYQKAPSIASQTAWALLALMAAGEVSNPAVARGVDWLTQHREPNGLWSEEQFTGTGFPRVFYLRYHGYPKFFPLWALARYRNLRRSNSATVAYGL
ncbi:MAG: squalene-hopene/tetraprenyl-beta-curcumene cyclase [Variibacter sp.]|nr:squalene-hopene/tetraprenyl-beta-curcumene cyclase [Variibacter sp.]